MPKKWKREQRKLAREKREEGLVEALMHKAGEAQTATAAAPQLSPKEEKEQEMDVDAPVRGHAAANGPESGGGTAPAGGLAPAQSPAGGTAIGTRPGGFYSHSETLPSLPPRGAAGAAAQRAGRVPIDPRVQTLRWKATQVVVQPGGVFSFPIQVRRQGSRLSWCFQTKAMDVDFSVKLVQDDGDVAFIVPQTRFDSHKEPVFATGRVEKPGTCIFTWDNSYSWVNPKTLVYSIELTYEVDEADDSERQHARESLISLDSSLSTHEAEAAALERRLPEATSEADRAREAFEEARAALEKAEGARRDLAARADAVAASLRRLHHKKVGLVWQSLAPAARHRVLQFVGPAQVARWECVSRQWRTMSRAEDVWEVFARANGADTRAPPAEDGGTDGEGGEPGAEAGERGIATGRSRALTLPDRPVAPQPTWHAAFLATLRG